MSRYRVVNTKQNQADYKTGQLLDRDTESSDYVLPTASQSIKGGVRVGNNLYMTGETLNATDQRYDDTEVFERLDNLDEDIMMIDDDIASLTLEKQDKLVSGTTIKTINGESLLGSGDVQAIGIKGDPGKDGYTPYIGLNGNWWINNQDTGVPAQGIPGNDGITPHIGDNGNWFIGLLDTGVQAQGQTGATGIQGLPGETGSQGIPGNDGITPHIGDNGNWFIGTLDTGVQAQGQTGATGATGISPHIGDNGNWYVGNTDTGVRAQGPSGESDIILKTLNFTRGSSVNGTLNPNSPLALTNDGTQICSAPDNNTNINIDVYASGRRHLTWDVSITGTRTLSSSTPYKLSIVNNLAVGFTMAEFNTIYSTLTDEQLEALLFLGTSAYIEDVDSGTILGYMTPSSEQEANIYISAVDFANQTTTTGYSYSRYINWRFKPAQLGNTTVKLTSGRFLRWHVFGQGSILD